MALIAKQQVSPEGLTVTYTACAGGGDTVLIGARTVVKIRNASGGALTATCVVPGTKWGQANPDVAKSVPATTGEVDFGPIPAEWADSNGLLSITYSGVTSLTIAVIEV